MDGGDTQRTVLIVDDDAGLLRLIEKSLRREGFATATADSGKAAIQQCIKGSVDLMLLDLKLQDVEGRELVRQLQERNCLPPFIIITGQGDERVAVDMMKRGALDYLVKDKDFLGFVPEVVKRASNQLETGRRLAVAEEQVNLIQSVMERGFSAVLIANTELPDPQILYLSPTFAKLTGCTRDESVGQRLSSLSGLTAIQNRLENFPQDESILEIVSPYQTLHGERWGEWRVGPVKDKSGRITHWLVILRDITDRKRLEQEILEISDREQRRIGQDLHDGLCQHLAGIELMSQVLEQKLASRSKAEAIRVGEIAGHVREAISQTRLLARGLSPLTLDSEGLMSGLQELASNTEKLFGVKCDFKCDAPVLVHDNTIATHLFRMAQEAVSNAIKHGKAKRINIELRRIGDSLSLAITDDGSGIAHDIPKNKGMGLRIMQSRAGMIGGTFNIESNRGRGACVKINLPHEPQQNATSRGGKK
jgi:PAS domain S-box-containing protein